MPSFFKTRCKSTKKFVLPKISCIFAAEKCIFGKFISVSSPFASKNAPANKMQNNKRFIPVCIQKRPC